MALLAVPRIVRFLYPEVWAEDDFYLENAFLVSRGMRPYVDFVHPHMPVLEWAAAAWLKLFGASHASIEVANEGAIYAASLLTFGIARHVAGHGTAICAALLYATSSLVFRYHVYERENFIAVSLLGAVLLSLKYESERWRWSVILRVAALMILPCTIKYTSVISGTVLLGYLIARGRRREGLVVGAILLGGMLSLIGIFHWLYGPPFMTQTIFFHFMKGRDTAGSLVTYPAQILDILVPFFALGVVRWLGSRPRSAGLTLVVAMVATEYAFFGWLSPTAWGHNYLESLPFIAILAGSGLERFLAGIATLLDGSGPADWAWVGGGIAAVMALLFEVVPVRNQQWLHGSVYGFGFIPKRELAELSRSLRDNTTPSEPVIAPALFCFEAGRSELIAYPETYGVYRAAEEAIRKYGFFEARRRLDDADFVELIVSTSHYWSEQVRDAITSGRVNAVIPDSELLLLPLMRPPLAPVGPAFLTRQGFRVTLRTEHFALWVRPVKRGGD